MYTIAALYHFAPVADPTALQADLKTRCHDLAIKGTLLVAPEGLNGTIAGSQDAIGEIIAYIRSLSGFSSVDWKLSHSCNAPFGRLKVRLKKEIVTMGQPDVDPLHSVGRYVEAQDWNSLIQSDDVVVIDTRNSYEVGIGTFDGAIDPGTDSFREFPAWWDKNKSKYSGKKIAMFCTGGIRCEKSTSYLVQQGVEDVFHLKGGILKYLETVDEKDSKWVGECFVFDGRVSVGHGLEVGPHQLCHGCRQPILPEDVKRPEFEAGVSCHQCYAKTSDADKSRFRERQKQLQLAKSRTREQSDN